MNARCNRVVAVALGLAVWGCATTKDAELGLPNLSTEGEGDGDDGERRPPAPPPPAVKDARYGFSRTLSSLWEIKNPIEALPALATFEGGAAVALRTDQSAQALLLVVVLDAEVESSAQNRQNLEKIAREKARDQSVAVEYIETVEPAGHQAVRLIGRHGGRNSARMHLVFVHAGNRRFELQCRRAANAEHACNAVFDELEILPVTAPPRASP